MDGSIYAAKMRDDSFTLSNPLSNNTTTAGERSYNGKYWVGEPVRLRVGNGHDVMITHQIIEKLKQNSISTSSASVHIVGDVYRYKQWGMQSWICEALHPWKGGSTKVRHQRRQTATGFKVTASIAIWTVGHISRLPQRHFSFQSRTGDNGAECEMED